MTVQEKLKLLQKEWGHLEISQATIRISGWRIWLVKNYKGRPISEVPHQGLPGNPRASKKLEYSGSSPERAIYNAYRSLMHKRKQQAKKKNAA